MNQIASSPAKINRILDSMKSAAIQDIVWNSVWISFVSCLFFRASHGFGLDLEFRLTMTAIFGVLIAVVNFYGKKAQYLKDNALLLAMTHTKNKISGRIDYGHDLNDTTRNAPLLMALEYKTGDAATYLGAIGYRVDAGYKWANYKELFEDILHRNLGYSLYDEKESIRLDNAVNFVCSKLDYYRYAVNFRSITRTILFYEVAQTLEENKLSAYTAKDLTECIKIIRSKFPDWSPYRPFFDAVLHRLSNHYFEPTEGAEFDKLVNKINMEKLAQCLPDQLQNFEVESLIPSDPEIVNNLKLEYQDTVATVREGIRSAQSFAKSAYESFKLDFDQNGLCDDFASVCEMLTNNDEAILTPDFSFKQLAEYKDKIDSEEYQESLLDDDWEPNDYCLQRFGLDRAYSDETVMTAIAREGIEGALEEFDGFHPKEDFDNPDGHNFGAGKSTEKHLLLGMESIRKAGESSYPNYKADFESLLPDLKPCIHLQIGDRATDYDVLKVNVLCFYNGSGFYRLSARHALNLHNAYSQGYYLEDGSELSEGMWVVESEKLSDD